MAKIPENGFTMKIRRRDYISCAIIDWVNTTLTFQLLIFTLKTLFDVEIEWMHV